MDSIGQPSLTMTLPSRPCVGDRSGLLRVPCSDFFRLLTYPTSGVESIGVPPLSGRDFRGRLQRNQLGGPNGTRANLHNSSTRFHCTLIIDLLALPSGISGSTGVP